MDFMKEILNQQQDISVGFCYHKLQLEGTSTKKILKAHGTQVTNKILGVILQMKVQKND
jgi:hypothetical protein